MLVRMNGIGIELKLSGSNRLGFQHRPDLTGTDQTYLAQTRLNWHRPDLTGRDQT